MRLNIYDVLDYRNYLFFALKISPRKCLPEKRSRTRRARLVPLRSRQHGDPFFFAFFFERDGVLGDGLGVDFDGVDFDLEAPFFLFLSTRYFFYDGASQSSPTVSLSDPFDLEAPSLPLLFLCRFFDGAAGSVEAASSESHNSMG